MRRTLMGMAGFGILAAIFGCADIVGADFSGYSARACSPVAQTCANGLHCRYDTASNTIGCTDQAGGTVADDGPCTTEDDCADGYACVSASGSQSAHCTKYCASDGDCDPGRPCVQFTTPRYVDDAQTSTVGACAPLSPPCDPFSTSVSAPCTSGQRCTVIDSQYTVCDVIATAGIVGQTCAGRNDCVEGDACASTDGGKTFHCVRTCKVGVAGSCTTGSCIGYNPAVMIGSDQLGRCP